ncbi:hypothetical protein ACQ7NX_20555 [Enterobacter cloacae subsp. dissolvens]
MLYKFFQRITKTQALLYVMGLFSVIGIIYWILKPAFSLDSIITDGLKDINNLPNEACISLPGHENKLPGSIETSKLMKDVAGDILRDDVKALKDMGLIEINLKTSKGPSALSVLLTQGDTNSLSNLPEVSLSDVKITPTGDAFYRYKRYRDYKYPGALFGVNQFCAHVIVGDVVSMSKPINHQPERYQNLMSWVIFRWKFDEDKTPWMSNSVLKKSLLLDEQDTSGWFQSGILTELNKKNEWVLGDEPYTIRW